MRIRDAVLYDDIFRMLLHCVRTISHLRSWAELTVITYDLILSDGIWITRLVDYLITCQLFQLWFNPLSPHDASKHHFTSLKTDLSFLQEKVLGRKFTWNWFINTWQFSLIFKAHPLQVVNCDNNSRLVGDEDDDGKLRLERVNNNSMYMAYMSSLGLLMAPYIIVSLVIGSARSCTISTPRGAYSTVAMWR